MRLMDFYDLITSALEKTGVVAVTDARYAKDELTAQLAAHGVLVLRGTAPARPSLGVDRGGLEVWSTSLGTIVVLDYPLGAMPATRFTEEEWTECFGVRVPDTVFQFDWRRPTTVKGVYTVGVSPKTLSRGLPIDVAVQC